MTKTTTITMIMIMIMIMILIMITMMIKMIIDQQCIVMSTAVVSSSSLQVVCKSLASRSQFARDSFASRSQVTQSGTKIHAHFNEKSIKHRQQIVKSRLLKTKSAFWNQQRSTTLEKIAHRTPQERPRESIEPPRAPQAARASQGSIRIIAIDVICNM